MTHDAPETIRGWPISSQLWEMIEILTLKYFSDGFKEARFNIKFW